MDYSPWCCKELDMTEQLLLSLFKKYISSPLQTISKVCLRNSEVFFFLIGGIFFLTDIIHLS